ncbi:LpxA family transferase [Arenibacter sp. BSSL-BM3]|uniref:LpxA family transferase n=1 Tax=Arenibacter arenosicollis TaxID=2762274 RepID=A0ABR7QJB4_9FLAO|nr:LpxA family transferase [Arenibacter arenosicollis]MBC8767258.1 LpxA family transferase [Arenibacter arenosicollis]
MIPINDYIENFYNTFPDLKGLSPWGATQSISSILIGIISGLDPDDYSLEGDIAIHKTAIIEKGVILKGPMIISENSFVASHAYLRGGVFLAEGVRIGPGSEIKSSIICSKTTLAHFNFIGDSIIGRHVNFEAGSLIANHYNERTEKTIWVSALGKRTNTGTNKFGALVGDNSKIGANAVLSPGTILSMGSIVKRLELIEQNK